MASPRFELQRLELVNYVDAPDFSFEPPADWDQQSIPKGEEPPHTMLISRQPDATGTKMQTNWNRVYEWLPKGKYCVMKQGDDSVYRPNGFDFTVTYPIHKIYQPTFGADPDTKVVSMGPLDPTTP